jgi:fructokinase
VIQENVAWDFLEASQPAQSLMLQASAVCFGTLAQRSETARRSMHVLLAGSRSDCLLVYDVNLRQHWYQKDWIEDSLFLADIAKLNHDEALVLARVLELGVASPLEIANALQSRFDIRLVCITRGAQGCLLATDQGHVDLPGQLVKTVDSVGAGDAFTAALIYSHWQDWDLARRGQFANRIGGLVAARCGAMPDLAAEFSELQGEFGDRLS